MKKFILFLITCLILISPQLIYCENNVAADKTVTFKNYCNKKIEAAKEKLNNGYKWVKNNPKKSMSAATTFLLLTGLSIYTAKEYKKYGSLKYAFYKNKEEIIYKIWESKIFNKSALQNLLLRTCLSDLKICQKLREEQTASIIDSCNDSLSITKKKYFPDETIKPDLNNDNDANA